MSYGISQQPPDLHFPPRIFN